MMNFGDVSSVHRSSFIIHRCWGVVMATLIVEHSGKRRAAELNGRTSIGRLSTSDVVIDHPTVSRTHAWIEQADGVYYIRDTGSINGTLIGEKPVADRYPLHDGDCIRIGPASITFCDTTPHPHRDNAPPTQSKDFSETGILFTCECGARLWMPAGNSGMEATCRKCGHLVVIPDKHHKRQAPEAPLAPIRPTVPPVAPIVTEKAICSICQWELKPTDDIHKCPECGLTFHAECWTANCGCSAYGCKQVNALAPTDEAAPAAPSEDIGHPPEVAHGEPASRLPKEHALLAGSVIAALLGALAFGLPALGTGICCVIPIAMKKPLGKSPIVLLAALVSLIGFVGGIVFSWIWWL
jgi:hypothetical protein